MFVVPFVCCSEKPSVEADFTPVNACPETCVSHDPRGQSVAYTGDVGGSWEHFCGLVSQSRGLRFSLEMDDGRRRSGRELELWLEDGWHFVYGGDACANGPGTQRILEALVGLKQQWPSRVHLLLGVGDLEARRWVGELTGDLEPRREELAHRRGVVPEELPDEAVLRSCREALGPGGFVWQYLRLAQMAVLLGDTVFIHGDIVAGPVSPEDIVAGARHKALQKLGMAPEEDDLGLDLQSWVGRLNSWVRRKVRQWELVACLGVRERRAAHPKKLRGLAQCF